MALNYRNCLCKNALARICPETLEYHYGKHHAAYVKKSTS
jgi:superoxide dismutase